MDKYFICLANSYKRGGRCIAGVEVVPNSDAKWKLVRNDDGIPRWIRPIARTTYGEIPNFVGESIKLLSIVKLTNVVPCPENAHTENVYYSHIEQCDDDITQESNVMNQLIDTKHQSIFHNRGRAVSAEMLTGINYSLMLIHPEKASAYIDVNREKSKNRMCFSYYGVEYDFPITDPSFIECLKKNPEKYANMNDVYLTLSLGLEFEGWHHKLVAGVLMSNTNNERKYIKKKKYTIGDVSFNMIQVSGGKIVLGANDGCSYLQEHCVSLKDYWISESVVTNELWEVVMGKIVDDDKKYIPATACFQDCLLFLFKLSDIIGVKFRLPSLDEWENAARGGKYSLGYKFSGSDAIDEVAWYDGNSGNTIHPVMRKKPNELGLYDMSGNVFEYCADNETEEVRVDCNKSQLFVLYRGGSYFAPNEVCSVAFLFDWDQGGYAGFGGYGIRLCLSDIDENNNVVRIPAKTKPTDCASIENSWFDEYERELARLLDMKSEIEEQINNIRVKILQGMESHGLETIRSEQFSVNYTPAKTIMQFDNKAFRTENEELYSNYCKPKQREASIVVKRNKKE